MNNEFKPRAKIIETQSMTLDEWLDLLNRPKSPGTLFIDYEFPTLRHRDDYLRSVCTRTDEEVRNLLRRFLIPSSSMGIDRFSAVTVIESIRAGVRGFISEHDRRLLAWVQTRGKVLPWEGITWVLDLLPHHPRKAIEAIDAYWIAHCQALPDGRLIGIDEAKSIIRAKYILHGDVENGPRVLETLSWRELEVLTGNLFLEMGYNVELTPERNDGGRDLVAIRSALGFRERCLVQCKKYNHPVGPSDVRELIGVVFSEKANKGVLVATSRFTKGAAQLANSNSLELIDRSSLMELLNEHLGTSWPLHIATYLSQARLEPQSSKRQG